MLFTRGVLDRVVAGEVDLAFRRWRRAQVTSGALLRTAVGVIAVDGVGVVTEEEITEGEAQRAGFNSRNELLATLRQGEDRQIHRIAIHFHGADPRVRLRDEDDLSAGELEELTGRLARIDARSRRGPWTRQMLALIGAHPAVRAGDLAALVGRERLPFKADVRKLKEHGLTESLETGYRLSPRGRALLTHITREEN
ncbi:MAG TPA: hypothetical protein VGO89_00140 [Streptomyces sp.]|nr:hypothetical protein [Streptomyces sp.]